jgi:hypothetical protein
MTVTKLAGSISILGRLSGTSAEGDKSVAVSGGAEVEETAVGVGACCRQAVNPKITNTKVRNGKILNWFMICFSLILLLFV